MRWSAEERREAEAHGVTLFERPPAAPRCAVPAEDGGGAVRLVS